MENMIRLVVFDCDGTLVDSQHVIVQCMQQAFEDEDRSPPTANAVRRIVGLSLDAAVAVLAPELPAVKNSKLVEAYRAAFVAMRQQDAVPETLYEGTREALDAIEASGCLLAVATGKSRRGLESTLGHHDLTRYFVSLQTADGGPGKPHPDMLHRAMNETGMARHETVLIGDTTFDMEMAQNAGVTGLGVAWGYHEVDELHGAGAHDVLSKWDEAPGAVAALAPSA